MKNFQKNCFCQKMSLKLQVFAKKPKTGRKKKSEWEVWLKFFSFLKKNKNEDFPHKLLFLTKKPFFDEECLARCLLLRPLSCVPTCLILNLSVVSLKSNPDSRVCRISATCSSAGMHSKKIPMPFLLQKIKNPS